jgi:hypothetical protein
MAVSRTGAALAREGWQQGGREERERRQREERERSQRDRRGEETRGDETRGGERGGLTYYCECASAKPQHWADRAWASRIFLPTAMDFCGEATFCGAGDRERPPGNLGCALLPLHCSDCTTGPLRALAYLRDHEAQFAGAA